MMVWHGSSVRVQIGAESKVMHKLQQHAGKMSEQLEFVKGSIVAAADIRSHLERYLDNLQVRVCSCACACVCVRVRVPVPVPILVPVPVPVPVRIFVCVCVCVC